jgi:hypothetical protein
MMLGVWKENPLARNVLSEAVVATLVFALSARWYRADDPKHAELHRLDRDLRTPRSRRTGRDRERSGGLWSDWYVVARTWRRSDALHPAAG